jgi:hypothetical protein
MRTGNLAKTFAHKNMGKVLFHLLGAGVYVLIGVAAWRDPRLADYPGASGGAPIVVGMLQLPIIVFFALLNILNFLSILWACIDYLRTRRWSLGWAYLAVPVIWMFAIWLDGSQRWID